MVQVRHILFGVAIWACFVIVLAHFYAFDALLSRGLPAPTVLLSQPAANDGEWDVVRALSRKDIEDLRLHGLNLRGVTCAFDRSTARFLCSDSRTGSLCPVDVTPVLLSLAHGQGPCQPENVDDMYCTAHCADGLVEWRAHSRVWCAENKAATDCAADPLCCPEEPHTVPYEKLFGSEGAKVKEPPKPARPFQRGHSPTLPANLPNAPTASLPSATLPAAVPISPLGSIPRRPGLGGRRPGPAALPQTPVPSPAAPTLSPDAVLKMDAEGFLQPFLGQAALDVRLKTELVTHGFNTRGLICQEDHGEAVCYRQDNQARERCGKHVTPAFLSLAQGQWTCMPENKATYYCTAQCQEGVDEVRWSAHEKAWCAQHRSECPPEPPYVPVSDFSLPPVTPLTTGPIRGRCSGGAGARGPVGDAAVPDEMAQISVGILANGETASLRDALVTWAEGGLLQSVHEVVVFLNSRSKDMETVVAPYTAAPYKVRIMGNEANHGITNAINWLAGNATVPFFLFLEKDFQMIETFECMTEQLAHGVRLLRDRRADVVKFRSRRHPGFPNWVDKYYRGHEDDCLTSNQPNLFCNVYHWVEEPQNRWPKHFWNCDTKLNPGKKSTDDELPPPAASSSDSDGEVFYCSDAEFCNWTNNPFMFDVAWWTREYIQDRFQRPMRGNNPFQHLEGYMNWEPGSWNKEGWTVAQGEGLFTHRDRNNYGS